MGDRTLLSIIAAVSLVMMGVTAVVTPWLLVRLPSDYFDRSKPHLLDRVRGATPARALVIVLKNLAGLTLLAAGVAMLVLPGQGVITILLATVLIDFPRKLALERWLVSRGKVLRTVNWLRAKAHRPPLTIRQDAGKSITHPTYPW